MIEVLKSSDRHFTDFGWLKTYWLFSFAHYFDPHNIQFGALRVFNDDAVEPGQGFPTHPHEEMEIITIVLEGEVSHKDSMGNEAVIRAGDVQRMSAGTGLTHSEFNLAEEPVHFYQIWIFPDEKGLEPSYDQKFFDPATWRNKLTPVASGQGIEGVVTFHTDATIYRCELNAGKEVRIENPAGRRIFTYLTDGDLDVSGMKLLVGDQARADEETPLVFRTNQGAGFVVIDVPSCKGWGYSEETLRGSRG